MMPGYRDLGTRGRGGNDVRTPQSYEKEALRMSQNLETWRPGAYGLNLALHWLKLAVPAAACQV